MSGSTIPRTELDEAIAALRRDLISEEGPRISTMRNYRFAIVPYHPEDEYKLRQKINSLSNELKSYGWMVLSISLQKLLMDRIAALGDDVCQALIAREKRTYQRSPERALNYLRNKLAPQIEGPEGIAADVSRIICSYAAEHPEKAERAVAFIGRAGALYPFFRTSALLKHLDGRTRNVPVVLLYPGELHGNNALSFMGEIQPDGDYRPRIYP